MDVIFNQISDYYDEFEKKSDPRLAGSYLSSPTPVFMLTAAYYYFIYYGGRQFMENRRPYNLKNVIIVYNFLQVLFNALVFCKAVVLLPNFLRMCLPLDFTHNPVALEVLQYAKYYYYLKLADYADTIFFVLRKKYSHVSFLHVYHHILMVVLGWTGLKISPGGHLYYLVLFNAFVHSIMYAYYLLAALEATRTYVGPYKKYVTRLQLAQFVGLAIIFAVALKQPTSCTIPRIMLYLGLVQAFVMIGLFSNFYYNAYVKSVKSKTQ